MIYLDKEAGAAYCPGCGGGLVWKAARYDPITGSSIAAKGFVTGCEVCETQYFWLPETEMANRVKIMLEDKVIVK